MNLTFISNIYIYKCLLTIFYFLFSFLITPVYCSKMWIVEVSQIFSEDTNLPKITKLAPSYIFKTHLNACRLNILNFVKIVRRATLIEIYQIFSCKLYFLVKNSKSANIISRTHQKGRVKIWNFVKTVSIPLLLWIIEFFPADTIFVKNTKLTRVLFLKLI